MLISVIVPVYNVAPYLRKCLESLLMQTYSNLQIILVNDGSTDESGKICDEYALQDERVRVIHKENGGQASARNKGLDVANGDFVSFVDGDDWLDLCTFEKVVPLFSDKHIDAVFWGFQMEYEDAPSYQHLANNRKVYDGRALLDALLFTNDFGGTITNALYRTSSLRDVRFLEGYLHEDEIFFVHLLAHRKLNKLQYVPEAFYHYRKGRVGSTMQSTSVKHLSDLLNGLELVLQSCISTHTHTIPQVDVKAYVNGYILKMMSNWYSHVKNSVLRNEIDVDTLFESFLNRTKEYALPNDWRMWDLKFFRTSPSLHYRYAKYYQALIRRLHLSEQYV